MRRRAEWDRDRDRGWGGDRDRERDRDRDREWADRDRDRDRDRGGDRGDRDRGGDRERGWGDRDRDYDRDYDRDRDRDYDRDRDWGGDRDRDRDRGGDRDLERDRDDPPRRRPEDDAGSRDRRGWPGDPPAGSYGDRRAPAGFAQEPPEERWHGDSPGGRRPLPPASYGAGYNDPGRDDACRRPEFVQRDETLAARRPPGHRDSEGGRDEPGLGRRPAEFAFPFGDPGREGPQRRYFGDPGRDAGDSARRQAEFAPTFPDGGRDVAVGGFGGRRPADARYDPGLLPLPFPAAESSKAPQQSEQGIARQGGDGSSAPERDGGGLRLPAAVGIPSPATAYGGQDGGVGGGGAETRRSSDDAHGYGVGCRMTGAATAEAARTAPASRATAAFAAEKDSCGGEPRKPPAGGYEPHSLAPMSGPKTAAAAYAVLEAEAAAAAATVSEGRRPVFSYNGAYASAAAGERRLEGRPGAYFCDAGSSEVGRGPESAIYGTASQAPQQQRRDLGHEPRPQAQPPPIYGVGSRVDSISQHREVEETQRPQPPPLPFGGSVGGIGSSAPRREEGDVQHPPPHSSTSGSGCIGALRGDGADIQRPPPPPLPFGVSSIGGGGGGSGGGDLGSSQNGFGPRGTCHFPGLEEVDPSLRQQASTRIHGSGIRSSI